MKGWWWALPLAMAAAGCGGRHETVPTAAESSAVEREVRAFAQRVASDVTREGPAAWARFFAEDPAFFMAVNGQVAFVDGAAAKAAIPGIARAIPQIELQWGKDLRVDVLGPDVAAMAAPYHELQVQMAGQRVEENGYFTGTVQRRAGQWKFRNAHWSSAVRKQ